MPQVYRVAACHDANFGEFALTFLQLPKYVGKFQLYFADYESCDVCFGNRWVWLLVGTSSCYPAYRVSRSRCGISSSRRGVSVVDAGHA